MEAEPGSWQTTSVSVSLQNGSEPAAGNLYFRPFAKMSNLQWLKRQMSLEEGRSRH